MAPEQARGDVVDARADLYSVGVLAYEMLAGELPFKSTDALAMALMHAQDPVPRLPAVKSHWQGFVDRAMAKSPDRRYGSASQMLDALDHVGRRSGSHFSGRALRVFDRSVAETKWTSPRMLALIGGLLMAMGLYAGRDRLPHFGGIRAPAKPIVTVRHPIATAPTPTVAAAASTAPAAAASISQPASTTADAAPTQPEATKHTTRHRHSTTARRQPPPERPGFFHRMWNRIRHP
jgi:serine/threonine protein kinase